MGVKLKHASGNGTVIGAPAANPSADITLKAPSTTGSAGQVLKVASANHSSTNAELEWAADSGGLFSSYALIEDQKAHDTHGGTFTSGAWRTRDLNTEIADPDSIVSIASNRFTLGAGTYLIKWRCPVREVAQHMTRLYNYTDTAVVRNGSSEYSDDVNITNDSSGMARTTISGSKAFEIQHYCSQTRADIGFGVSVNAGDDPTEQYTQVEIYKEA